MLEVNRVRSVNTRGKLVPDPKCDPITCIFWGFQSGNDRKSRAGIMITGDAGFTESMLRKLADVSIDIQIDEVDMINSLIGIVRDLDPDILTGYEVHSSSWGFVIERYRELMGNDLPTYLK